MCRPTHCLRTSGYTTFCPRNSRQQPVSNLVALGPFTTENLVRSNIDEILFKKPDGLTTLWISRRLGAINLQSRNSYGPTNLAEHIPKMTDLMALTTNLLGQLNIRVEDMTRNSDGSPAISFSEPFTVYLVNHTFVTNVGYRAANFRRAVDGARFVGNGAGGDGEIQFGAYGKPTKISLSWRNLERHRFYGTADPDTIRRWIRAGKAVQGMMRMDLEPIDWKSVKSVTITGAKLCYYAGGPFEPSDWLMPFVALWTTVDTGHGKVDVEIDCPIIDESKPLKDKR